ncbi:hybrid sensor histidine kinase/response regulator [Geothermobacter hydrogeniphilus]|uniref:histidine kinase n=1 Tax=Geothermobacter hydrogeniphilus TaxID=1969733 RepID=A0A1X0Y3T4_9BACT|nr:ATP-binding protein [Geothermobacter hydrogeniphilus]ORJ59840.1 hypothetical protein B5V00_09200 [Geothermobacter hydrogeniphilus]
MKISIRSALLVSFLVVIWGTYLITASLGRYSSEKTLENHARLIMDGIASYAMEQSQNYLGKAEKAADLTKRLLKSKVLGQNNLPALEAYFLNQLKIYPDIAGIYLGTPEGEFYYVSRNNQRSAGGFRTKEITFDKSGSRRVRLDWWDADGAAVGTETAADDRYDPRQRPWYRGAIDSGGIFWTDPYIFYTSQNPGVTISGPSYRRDGSLRGVVGVDIEIDQLSTFIAKLRIGSHGQALLLNRNREVVAFHDVEQIKHHQQGESSSKRLVTIDEFSDPLSRAAVAAVGLPLAGDKELHLSRARYAKFSHDGVSYLAMFTPFPNPHWPWVIGMYMPEDDYLGALKASRHRTRLVALGISLLASLFACWLAASLSRPILGLRRYATRDQEPVSGDVPSISASRFLEISETASCFERIQQDLADQTLGRRHAELFLQRAEEQYRSLVENLNVGVFRTRLDGRIVNANPELVRMAGCKDLEELKRHRIEDFYAEPQDRRRLIELLREQGSVRNWEVRMLSLRRSEPHWSLLHVTLNRSGDEEFLDGLVEDISDRKRQEEMLIAAERMAAVGTLTSGVAHEFNNINTGVLGYAELGLQQKDLPPQAAAFFDLVRAAALRSKELTGSLLSISNRNQTRMVPALLHEVVEESLSLVKGEMISDGIELRQEIKPMPPLLFDRVQIGQVVLNLLLNARHALLGQPTRRISISTGEDGDEIWVRVEDSGCGIDREDLPRIFTPFFSTKGEHAAPESHQALVKGSGLGLSVCHTIAVNHHGSLSVESTPGKGSCFTLTLPRVPANDDSECEPVTIPPPIVRSRILLLDDEQVVRDIVCQVLSNDGYNIEATDDGNEALRIAGEKPLDLILVDLQMPKMSGRDFLARLKGLGLDNPPRALILTGQVAAEQDIAESLHEFGVIGLVPKPFTLVELREQVSRALSAATVQVG